MAGQPRGTEAEKPRTQDSPSVFKRAERHLWRRIISGFLVLVPLLVTYLVLRLVFNYVDGFFRPMVSGTILDFPGIGVAFTLVLFYAVGALVSGEAGRRAIDWQNAVLTRIPVVRSIYGVARQATDALSSPMGHNFSRVVFVEWPRPGTMAMGFVTGHCHSPDGTGETLVAVYIPTVPNPTSGMLTFVSPEELTEPDITIEEAMKAVFSGGIVLPSAMSPAPRGEPVERVAEEKRETPQA